MERGLQDVSQFRRPDGRYIRLHDPDRTMECGTVYLWDRDSRGVDCAVSFVLEERREIKMDGIWGAYLMLGGLALIMFIVAIWPSKKKKVE